MSQCPFANFPNLIDPETYVNGMPYETLRAIRESGPVHWMDGSYEGVPYWLVTGRDEIDFVSKNPKIFSSEARTALSEEWDEELLPLQRQMIINMDPPRQLKYRKIVRAAFTRDFLGGAYDRALRALDLALGATEAALPDFFAAPTMVAQPVDAPSPDSPRRVLIVGGGPENDRIRRALEVR